MVIFLFLILKKKHFIIGIIFLAIVLGAVSYTHFNHRTVSTSASLKTNWGLSFQEKGGQPAGNASSEYLKKYNSYYIGVPDKKTIYLTFDCGYENGYTPGILQALKKHDAKATFFIVGNYAKTSPEILKNMVDDGHMVGNHTFSHPDMSKIADIDSFKKEIASLEKAYKEATGKEIDKYYRPPQGKYNEDNLKNAKELGYKTIFWSLAYVDWYVDKQPTKEFAFDKLMSRIHPGAVVLLHNTSKTNSEILDELLSKWEHEGYTFGTLDQLGLD